MKYFFLIFLFFTINLFSQNFEKIKQSEVLFLLHSGINGNYQSKTHHNVKNQRTSFFYNFFFAEENYYSLQNQEIIFSYNHFYDFDEQYKDNPVPYFKVNKSFVRKNKDIIITGEFMQKIGYVEFVRLINNAKTIFLIDKTEKENKKIIVKEVHRFQLSLE